MRKYPQSILFVLLLFFLLCVSNVSWAACTGSHPTWTSTADYSSVNSCVNQAASGDTINVSAGTVTWSSKLTITTALKLIGPGKTNLTITAGYSDQYGTGMVTYTPTAGEASKTFEMSGFTFNGNSATGLFSAISPNNTNVITGLKIHDNAFNNGTARAIHTTGLEFGVFYNNTFSGNYISIGLDECELAGWQFGHSDFGTSYNLFFEDNTFGNGTGAFIFESGHGARIAFRHNTITGYTCSGCEVFDMHGNQDNGIEANVLAEIYHNTIGIGSNVYRWINQRGGKALIANNTVTGYAGSAFSLTEYHSWGGSIVSCTGYPFTHGGYEQQVSNSFYFNNLVSGSPQTPSLCCTGSGCCGTVTCGSSPYDVTFIQQNREYWLPTYGTEANLPSTCTANGNTYYGTTDTDKIFKCTSTNTWTVFYTPYTYPHPFRSGNSIPNPPPGLQAN